MTIGERIKARREELKMSQDDLAKRLGYKSRSSINKIEADQRSLRQSKIKAIADALETTPDYIMGWDDEKKDLADNSKVECPAYMIEWLMTLTPDEFLDVQNYIGYKRDHSNQ